MNEEIAYNLIKENNIYDKLLVKAGAVIIPLETGAAIFEAVHQKNYGGAIALGIASLITGYYTYKLHKKTKETDKKLKNLETELGIN